MTISICIEHKPTEYKIFHLFQPKKETIYDEMYVYETFIEILEICGISPDKHPRDLIDKAEYESEIYIIQVNIYEGHNVFVV
jgi:hypothetical protein